MRFKLDIRTDNAAFEDRGQEIARILREVAHQIVDHEQCNGSCFDINGNKVGEYGLSRR